MSAKQTKGGVYAVKVSTRSADGEITKTVSEILTVFVLLILIIILLLMLPKLGMCRPFQSCQERRISLPFQECTLM